MLYRNGENLKNEIIHYLSGKKKITIFSPYIKEKTLRTLLSTQGVQCDQIIVRWEPKDIAMGSSDLEVYEVCREKNISLYINNRIHLKLFTNNFEDAILGSANISERAISSSKNIYNYEICTYVKFLDIYDKVYLQGIINESILVTDSIYNSIKSQVPKILPDINDTFFDLPKNLFAKSDFLITKLPMIDSPEKLWELYSEQVGFKSIEQLNCFSHDLALYRINGLNQNKDDFFETLTNSFFDLPFIISFLKEVDNAQRITKRGEKREGLQFGAVKKWFADNTTTVPSPKTFELTTNVQILYTWIESLSNGKYSILVPGSFSQVIKKNF